MKLTWSNAGGLAYSKTVPITLTDNPGFDAIAYDAVNKTLIGSAVDAGNTENRIQVIYTGSEVFADSTGYVSQSKTPVDASGGDIYGDPIVGIATYKNTSETPNITEVTLLTADNKDFWVANMTAAAEVISVGEGFFSQPHCVTQDSINNIVYVCLEGIQDSSKGGGFNVYQRSSSGAYEAPSTNFEFGGTGEFSTKLEGGTFVAGQGLFVVDNTYWDNSYKPTIVLINVSDKT